MQSYFQHKRSLGQCFLHDPSVTRRIAATVDGSMSVLEIGAGAGALTAELAPRASSVTAIELDERLRPTLDRIASEQQNVEVVFADALKFDADSWARSQTGTPVVCANLPYYITTPLLTKLLETRAFAVVTVMVQKEFAERIAAAPNTSAYGSFTVFSDYYAKPTLLFSVPAACFTPRPKVDSAVVRLETKPKALDDAAEKRFFQILRAAFGNRRKTLRNNLQSLGIPKEATSAALAALDHPEDARGERLATEDFIKLAQTLY